MAKKPDNTVRVLVTDKVDLRLAHQLVELKQEERSKKVDYETAEGKRKNAEHLLKQMLPQLAKAPGEAPILVVDGNTMETIFKWGKARAETVVDVRKFLIEVLSHHMPQDMEDIEVAIDDSRLAEMLTVRAKEASVFEPDIYGACTKSEATGARQMSVVK